MCHVINHTKEDSCVLLCIIHTLTNHTESDFFLPFRIVQPQAAESVKSQDWKSKRNWASGTKLKHNERASVVHHAQNRIIVIRTYGYISIVVGHL